MIRLGRIFLALVAFLYVLAAVQELDQMNEPQPIWSPR